MAHDKAPDILIYCHKDGTAPQSLKLDRWTRLPYCYTIEYLAEPTGHAAYEHMVRLAKRHIKPQLPDAKGPKRWARTIFEGLYNDKEKVLHTKEKGLYHNEKITLTDFSHLAAGSCLFWAEAGDRETLLEVDWFRLRHLWRLPATYLAAKLASTDESKLIIRRFLQSRERPPAEIPPQIREAINIKLEGIAGSSLKTLTEDFRQLSALLLAYPATDPRKLRTKILTDCFEARAKERVETLIAEALTLSTQTTEKALLLGFLRMEANAPDSIDRIAEAVNALLRGLSVEKVDDLTDDSKSLFELLHQFLKSPSQRDHAELLRNSVHQAMKRAKTELLLADKLLAPENRVTLLNFLRNEDAESSGAFKAISDEGKKKIESSTVDELCDLAEAYPKLFHTLLTTAQSKWQHVRLAKLQKLFEEEFLGRIRERSESLLAEKMLPSVEQDTLLEFLQKENAKISWAFVRAGSNEVRKQIESSTVETLHDLTYVCLKLFGLLLTTTQPDWQRRRIVWLEKQFRKKIRKQIDSLRSKNPQYPTDNLLDPERLKLSQIADLLGQETGQKKSHEKTGGESAPYVSPPTTPPGGIVSAGPIVIKLETPPRAPPQRDQLVRIDIYGNGTLRAANPRPANRPSSAGAKAHTSDGPGDGCARYSHSETVPDVDATAFEIQRFDLALMARAMVLAKSVQSRQQLNDALSIYHYQSQRLEQARKSDEKTMTEMLRQLRDQKEFRHEHE